jgi:CDP-glycerol glycerophosphotransferase
MLGRIKIFLGKIIRLVYRLSYRLIPCDQKTVLFISFHGRGCSDNPKAIFEYLRSQNKDLNYIWAIKHHKQKNIQIEGAKVIEYFSIPYFYYLARAK